MKAAVVLLNLGGPDSLEAVEPFLYNLFCDRDIFKIPIGQKLFARIISKRRAPIVKEEYELIGGKSPINEWTEIQRKMLEKELKKNDTEIDVFSAMRYWHPLSKETAEKMERKNYEKIILLPLYPHFSVSTTGSSFNEWKRVYKGDKSKIVYVNNYFDEDDYIKSLNERIEESLVEFPEEKRNDVQLIFSAHGTPVSMVKKGDPYSIQIQKTVNKVMELRNFTNGHHLCFQSKVGPVKWLEPSTENMIKQLAGRGLKNLLIIPISFISDHVETLFELDIEYRKAADKCGIENYVVMKGLNDSRTFISALKNIALTYLKQ
ncbi:MAG: ferrochelatase [Ignavibacteria bacterium]|nr:ferrochelatase [Ignavibacteria bacterium]